MLQLRGPALSDAGDQLVTDAVRAWFSTHEIVRLSHIAHGFAATLSDAGVSVHNRERRVTYLQ